MDKNANIYLNVENQEVGPFTPDQLLENGLSPETLVWWQGLPNWVKAGEVPELQPLLQQAAQQQVSAQQKTETPPTIECPYCGEEILATARKCRFCNEWLQPVEGDAVSAPMSQPVAQLTCPDCGQLVPDNVLSCPHCGGPLSRMTSCVACGAQISRRAVVCPKCGTPVDALGNSRPLSKQPTVVKLSDDSSNKKSHLSSLLWTLLFFCLIGLLASLIYFMIDKKGSNNTAPGFYGDTTAVESIELTDTSVCYPEVIEGAVDSCRSTDNSSKKDVFFSEDLYTEGGDEGTNLGDKSVYFTRTWLEHGVDDGIKIHANMTAINLLGEQLEVTCFFWFDDGRQVKSTDGRYEAPNQQVCTSTTVTSNYQGCNWNDLTLWIPYNQIKGKRDYKHLKCRIEVFYRGHCLATSKFMHFGCSLE